MDDFIYNLDINWHNDLFKFDNISLGIIVQRGFFYSLCKIIRSMIITQNIIKHEQPTEIIAFKDGNPHLDEINNMIEYICSLNNVSINFISMEDNIKKSNQNLKNTHSSLLDIIGNSTAFKFCIKYLSKLIWLLNDLKMRIFRRKFKNILLYKYDYHETIAQKLSKKSNLILLSERPDILKNRDVTRLFKDKYCVNLMFYDLFNSRKIIKLTDFFFNKLYKNWEVIIEKPSFQQVFRYDNISFWPIFEKKLKQNLFPHFKGIIKDILIAHKILKKYNYDLIIFEVDSRDRERCMSIIASRMNIPTLVIQHGVSGQPLGMVPTFSTKVALWGKISQDYFKNYGLESKKIIITGAPRLDKYVFLNKNKHLMNSIKETVYNEFSIEKTKKLILLTTTHNTYYKRSNAMDLNHYEVEKMYNMVFNAMKNLPNSHLIIKLRQNDIDKEIAFKIKELLKIKNVSIIDNYNIANLIVSCDCLISGYSTTVIEAMLLEKPIVIIDFRKNAEAIPLSQYNIGYKASNDKELLNGINNSFDNPILLENYEMFLKDYLYQIDGMSTNRVIKVVNNLLSI